MGDLETERTRGWVVVPVRVVVVDVVVVVVVDIVCGCDGDCLL